MNGAAMEEREASIASSSDFYESERKPDTPPPETQSDALPAKRKAEDFELSLEKKRKLDSSLTSSIDDLNPCAGLPPAIWQHIFLFCPLNALGRLLQVNRSFHSYLTSVRHVSTAKPAHGFARLLKSESIWASGRNLHPTKPPKPLPGFGELQMWQLVWNTTCQFCGKQSDFTPGEKIWQKGPGATGVCVIWPFGIRSCGDCLLQKCQTDSSLLFSTASALRPALPCAFVTKDKNCIPAYTLQASTTPANVEIIKYYYKEYVDDISKELEDVLAKGPSAAEEWSKGLEMRGKERMKVAENWERWHVKYQGWRDRQESKRATSAAPSASSTQQQVNRPPLRRTSSPIIHAPIPANNATPYIHPRPPTIPPHVFTPQPASSVGVLTLRGERNIHDANEAKANRKLDIERRCQQLSPPINPNILRHMDSFKAAIQIPQPMNDYAWSMLQPRLLAQLPAAQQAESDHVSRVASLTTRAADRRQQDASLKEVKEVLDREWEESQRPIRDRLSAIADDFISQDWDQGRAVTYDNSLKFAVDLLAYVRRVFYAEAAEADGSLPEIDAGSDPVDSHEIRRPKLVLENMKWVYDNKLKPLTEQHRKELFLCYGSGCEGNIKFYGFEGVIQHFGAKHTNTFSVGNVVVAWREAEWPEDPPFHPDPLSVKHAYQNSSNVAGTSGTGHPGYNTYYSGYSRAGTSTPHMQTQMPQASPGPYHYGGHYNGPFPPPNAPTNSMTTYDYSQAYGPLAEPFSSYLSMRPPSYGPQMSSNGCMTSPAMTQPAIAPPPASRSSPQDTSDVEHRTNLFDKQVSTVIEMAQETWKQTSGIKDLPNNLRIYILLHRIISKFQIEFNHEPNLNHFIDALSNHQIPRALKNAPGLSCKACQDEYFHQSSTAFLSRAEENRTYTVLNLFSHFQAQHANPQALGFGFGHQPVHLDWKENMIVLPNDRFISGLIHTPGMDDEKLLMIATIFPRLFPTPLPRIGLVDGNGVVSPARSNPKETKEAARPSGTPGISIEQSGPSSLDSPYTDSPIPALPSEEEYDPQRPALLKESAQTKRTDNRRRSYQDAPHSADRRSRYYAEPRYYVGSMQDSATRDSAANNLTSQLPRNPIDDEYTGQREYVEVAPNPRRIRSSDIPMDTDHSGRRPLYRDVDGEFYGTSRGEVLYTHPRQGFPSHAYEQHPHELLGHVETSERQPESRFVREARSRDPSLSKAQIEADRFLEELGNSQLPPSRTIDQDSTRGLVTRPPMVDAGPDDSSRYTPPPPDFSSTGDQTEQGRSLNANHPTAPSTVSNGSRYDEPRAGGRQIATPVSGAAPHRAGPYRRRDRHQDYVPSRYYRYMSIARDEPYPRGTSMGRSQSRRYERYEQQRRRIDQQETPQPNADRDYEPVYSRDQSVDQPPPDDVYPQHVRHAPRDYVPIQDRLRPYSPPRLRYAGYPEDVRGSQPMYVDEYGQPVHEYEVIRIPRDHRQSRGPYLSHDARFYPEHDPEDLQYVSVTHDRPPPQRYNDLPANHVYRGERDGPLSARRTAFEPEREAPYDPAPPEIKIEGATSVPEDP